MEPLNKTPDEGFDLGILFVHGIGSQVAGETLVNWGDTLVKTISKATRNQVVAIAQHSVKENQNDAEMIVQIQNNSQRERWLIAEGRWSDTFLPPTYSELSAWSIRAVPWALTIFMAQRYWKMIKGGKKDHVISKMEKFLAASAATVQLMIALVLTPLIIVCLLLFLVLGLLPIAQLRSFILSAQGLLVSSIGDSMAFVESPVRASLIRTKIYESLHRLNLRCRKTVIVAHSQGAAVALDALGGIPEPIFSTKGNPYYKDLPPDLQQPDTLITFGAGTNQLASLKVLAAGPAVQLGFNPSTAALGAIAMLIPTIFYVIYHQFPYMKMFYAASLLIPGYILFEIIRFLANRLKGFYEKKKTKFHPTHFAVATVSPMAIVPVVLCLTLEPLKAIPVFPVGGIVVGVMGLLISLHYLLSKEVRSVITIVRKPPGLAHWVDLYASSDPVPNGPTNIDATENVYSKRIWNFGSFIYDHNSYWQNLDGFVLRVIKACCKTAGSPWINKLPSQEMQHEIDDHSKWRTRLLKACSIALSILWVGIGITIFFRHPTLIPHVIKNPPSWLPTSLLPTIEVITAGTFMLWASYIIVQLIWLNWTSNEQKIFLSHKSPTRDSGYFLLGGMMLVVMVILLASIILLTNPTEDLTKLNMAKMIQLGPVLVASIVLATYLIFLKPGMKKEKKQE